MRVILLLVFCFSFASAFGQKDSTMKGYLGVLTLAEKFREDKAWTKEVQAVVGEHFQRLLKYKKEGIVVLAGRTGYEVSNPELIGLVIFYAKNDEEARQFMMDDPCVKKNIMLAKVHPYGIAIK